MKLLIVDDMEGISGVVDWSHVDSRNAEYQRFRKIMTDEVNAAIEGAFDGGVDEVVVSDGHGGGKNILIEVLDARARLNSGFPSRYQMVEGVDNGVDAMLMVGYHARYGTQGGILAHTFSLSVVNAWLNDRLVGEIGFNASVAGHFGVPVLMISSDQAGCNEAAELIPGIETVPVKQGSGIFAAECLPPDVSQKQIRETAARVVSRFKGGKSPAPVSTSTPITLTVEFNNAANADRVSNAPGVVRIDGRKVKIEVADMTEAYGTMFMMLHLAGPVFRL
jgi:D-amino peptidase